MKIVIKHPGKPAEVVSIRRMSEIHKLIGGTAAKCFGATTEHGDLHGYCDDDGYKKELPPNFARPTDGHEILGPVDEHGRHARPVRPRHRRDR